MPKGLSVRLYKTISQCQQAIRNCLVDGDYWYIQENLECTLAELEELEDGLKEMLDEG